MLIEFVKNPQFQPAAPPIKVGSVVRRGTEKGVVSCVEASCIPYKIRLLIDKEVCALRDGVVWLPEKVSGITEDGEWEYAPIDPPSQEFSWDQYPPRAGMVVELIALSCVDRLRVLLVAGNMFFVFDGNGTSCNKGDATAIECEYRPRPDLMPRFVEGKP